MADGQTYIIAEIGQNHQGSLEMARELLRAAKNCGVDAVKSQKRHLPSLLTDEERTRPYDSPHSFGATYGEHRAALELSLDDWRALFDYARELDIELFASPWDIVSAAQLSAIGAPLFKIASATLTNIPLLERVARADRPVIVSTGMSTLQEIDAAVEALDGCELYLLQCTSAYPTSFDSINLRAIETLRRRYGLPVGLSGHHRGIAVDVAAVALGARVLERHFTLDRTLRGSDHAASLEPAGLARLVRDVRAVESALGDGHKAVHACEQASLAKLRGPRQRVAARAPSGALAESIAAAVQSWSAP